MSGRQQTIPGSCNDYIWSPIIFFPHTPQLSGQWRGWCGVPRCPLVHRAGQIVLSLPGCRWVAPRTGQPCLWAAVPACPPYCARYRSQNTQGDLQKGQHETLYMEYCGILCCVFCEIIWLVSSYILLLSTKFMRIAEMTTFWTSQELKQ